MIATTLALFLLFQGAAVRPGTVSGQLTSSGKPASGIRVSAIRAPAENTRVEDGAQYYFMEPAVSIGLTDNQGRYRLVDIPPGRYFVLSGETYYPSTLELERARVITVTAGGTIENIDFQLLLGLGGKVNGRVTPRPDAPGQKALLSGIRLQQILEVPVAADGSFEFGRVPRGLYVVELFPMYPGLGSVRVEVSDKDVTGVEVVRPPTYAVSGRIVVENGPLPRAILSFQNPQSYVGGTIAPDGTFTTRLHSARHVADMAGMPSGYSLRSVRIGNRDVTEGFVVDKADLSGLVITVAAPQRLPRYRGKIAGLANRTGVNVEMSGPIVGSVQAPVRQDGTFEFGTLTPGMYSLRLPQVPEFQPVNVVITWNDAEVQLAVPAR
jgi:hypothetical protein